MNDKPSLLQSDPQQGLQVTEDDPCRFTSEPVAGDQRQSYRYPAQLGQKEALVRRRGRQHEAEMVEESAGGIALEVPLSLELQRGEQIEVGIYSGWYRARVIHLQPGGSSTRVGLQRVAVLSSNHADGQAAGKGRCWRRPGSPFRTALVAFLAMVAGILVSMWLGGDFRFQSVPALPGGSISPRFADTPHHRRLMGMLEGVNLLTNAAAVKELQLSRDQQATLGTIFVGVSNELSSLYEGCKNQPPHIWYERSQSVVNEAVEDILCSLTDAQVARWRKMIIQKRQQQAAGSDAALLRQAFPGAGDRSHAPAIPFAAAGLKDTIPRRTGRSSG